MKATDPRPRLELAAVGLALRSPARGGALLERIRALEYEDPRAPAVLAVLEEIDFKEASDFELDLLADFLRFPSPAAYIQDSLDAADEIESPERLLELLEDRPPAEDPPEILLPTMDLAGEEPLDLPDEIAPGLPRGTVSILHGAEGAGKTILSLELAIAKASGRDWIGVAVGDAAPVFFVAQETGSAEIQARTRAFAEARGIPFEELRRRLAVVSETELRGRYLDLRRDGARLLRTVLELRSELIVIDHLSALSPDERDLGQVAIIEALRRLAVESGAAVLLLDHDNKAGNGERSAHAGRALKRRAAALTLWIGEERGAPFLDVGKAKRLSADERRRVWLRWVSLPDPWGRSSAGRPVSWGILEPAEEPPLSGGNGAGREGRLDELLELLPAEDWISTRDLIGRVNDAGVYKRGSAVGRLLRRDLGKLVDSGEIAKRAGAGRKPADWRKETR